MSGPTTSLPQQSGSGERERLGRFSLLRVVGRGASATVYEAMDTRMERAVALKVLSFDPLLTPDQRQRQIERFEREARAVARLSHPNIVAVYDVGEEDGKHFLVMELLGGITLRERIEQGGPIALGEATAIVEQIASALDCTHAEGIVHRDIKPSNVLLMPDGRVKMLDFGIARRGEDATVTHAGMLIGSPAYMSPEQGRGENASPASDIWALGALMYEMLTAQSPFGASNVAAVLYKAAYEQPQPLPDDVSRAQPIIDHSLAKQPEERYASAGAMANALRSAVDFSATAGRVDPTKRSLQDAAAGAFVASPVHPAPDTPTPLSTGETTAEALARPRSRLADFGVIAAWGAVTVAALGIVTVRMRQSASPTVPVSGTKSNTAIVTAPTSMVPTATPAPKRIVPSPKPSVLLSPPARIAAIKPTPRVAAKAVAATLPPPKPKPLARIAKAAVKTPVVPKPRPKPVGSVKPSPKKPAQVARVTTEPPWDDRVDRLGDPEPEPTPTPKPRRIVTPRRRPLARNESNDSREGTSGKSPYKPSALLGRWQGNIWKRSATLNVQTSDGEAFQGTLRLKTERGPLRFAIQGTFSPATGRISFWSSGTSPEAAAARIDLGQENGRLISARTMGGIGVDSNRRVFTWSFSR